MLRLRFGLLPALAIGLVVGCSGGNKNSASISGKVTYKGQPVPGGNVVFLSEDATFNAALSKDGSYEVTNVPPGNMKVIIDTEVVNPAKNDPSKYGAKMKGAGGQAAAKMAKMSEERWKAEGKGSSGGGDSSEGGGLFGPPPKEELMKMYMKIPSKYSHPSTSGLTVNLEAGKQTKDFDLTD